METNERSWLRIVAVEIEVNDLFSLDVQIVGDHLSEASHVPLIDLESVFLDQGDVVTKKVVHDTHAEDRLQFLLLVRLELLRAVQVDGKRRHLHDRSNSVPVSALEDISVLDDDFASQGEVTIEPGSPQTATVCHHVDLVVSSSGDLASGGDLEYGTVSVAAHDFETLYRLSAAFVAS